MFTTVLKNLGGKFVERISKLDGHNDFWIFPNEVSTEDIFLALDKENDSFYQNIDVTLVANHSSANIMISFTYVEP